MKLYFSSPMGLADDRKLRTIAECQAYIRELPESERQLSAWRDAAASLRKAAERGGPFVSVARGAFLNAMRLRPSVLPVPSLRENKTASPVTASQS